MLFKILGQFEKEKKWYENKTFHCIHAKTPSIPAKQKGFFQTSDRLQRKAQALLDNN
jgi:hypothetical protein